MPCYSPLQGYRSRERNPSGKRGLVFNVKDGYRDMPVEVPCGQCIGCRLERSRQWAMRCVHEASLYSANCFITLTYSDTFLPRDGSLDKRHFQLFIKRLRKRFSSVKIRYFHCGEYGELNKRPHYHALIFGFDFPDKELVAHGDGYEVYSSAILQELWPHGFCTLGDVTFESAAYVARYVVKKITGDAALPSPDGCPGHYSYVDLESGEVFPIVPEYVTMSLKPGIGQGWLNKYFSDVFPDDEVIVRGHSVTPPKFYFSKLEKSDLRMYSVLKGLRVRNAKRHKADSTPERLRVRERVKRAQIKSLIRDI